MKYCVECGSKLQLGAKFCVHCGTQILISDSFDTGHRPGEGNSRPINSKLKSDQKNLTANVRTRVKPIYGNGFRENEHCFNCGSKYGSTKRCLVCEADRI